MKRLKRFFETPRKAAVSIICIIAALALLGTGTVFAAAAIAENSSIGAENARNFAFADAGIDPLAATEVRTEFDFEDGQFVYEVEFIFDGTEYEYLIKASDGTVVKKAIDIITPSGTTAKATAQISLDEAKEAALADSGLSASEVTFTKTELDLDDGLSVYDIEFYAGNTEYEYEINAKTGAVYSKSRETLTAQAPQTTAQAPQTAAQPPQDTASAGQSQPNTGQSQPDTVQTHHPESQYHYEENQSHHNANQSQPDSTGLISLDTAKNTACADAGVSSSEVSYTKAKLDYEDGVPVYELEFCTSTYEYEYEINALTNTIRSKDVELRKNNTGSAGSSSSDIGVEQAKSIAAGHAGFSVSDVTFSKAKLEKEKDIMIYEIEFYKNGMEYEYEINAADGTIIKYDSDWDD